MQQQKPKWLQCSSCPLTAIKLSSTTLVAFTFWRVHQTVLSKVLKDGWCVAITVYFVRVLLHLEHFVTSYQQTSLFWFDTLLNKVPTLHLSVHISMHCVLHWQVPAWCCSAAAAAGKYAQWNETIWGVRYALLFLSHSYSLRDHFS